MIKEFVDKARCGEIDIIKHTEKVLKEAERVNQGYNYLNVIAKEHALEQAEALEKCKDKSSKKLLGVPVSIKDCICVKGVESRAGSKILSGYKPLFDAHVVEKLKQEGAIIIGKNSQDEFGFGGFSVNVGIGFKAPKNPFDAERSCGGSSGGSAGIVQKMGWPSLGESTGGSIVNPASFCGVIGLCPTYSRVSRYGLIDYGNSLDKIGPLAKTIDDAAMLLAAISGFDERDSTSISKKLILKKEPIKGRRIGLLRESLGVATDEAVATKIREYSELLQKKGAKVEEISLPINFSYGIPTYYILALCEASTNLAKYCGLRYGVSDKIAGNFNEFFTKVRSNNFGKEAKRRIILGTFARMAGYRDAYYIKAAKVRTKIIEEYQNAFKKYDLILSPTVPILPPTFSEIKKLTLLQSYMIDILTVGPNLAGLPHINIPIGFEKKLPIGALFVANHFEENTLLNVPCPEEK